jgi:hypothetical protein
LFCHHGDCNAVASCFFFWGCELNVYDPFLDWYEDRDERAVWEEKVRFALYSENARVRADVERKERKENPPDECADHEALD